jgi:DNA polymerase-3 subunit delta
MSYQAFLNEIDKGLPAPVYLFYASDPFILREALGVVKSIVPEADRDFNLHIFDLASTDDAFSVQQMLDVMNTVSFFSGRRFTVLIGNIQKLSKKDLEKIHDYGSSPAPNSVFVMLHNGAFKKDGKAKFDLPKQIPLDIRESEIPFWVKQRALMKGFEITDGATNFLIGNTGTDLGLLSSEIEKISMIGKKRIDINDIADIVTGGRLYNVFDLVSALKAKNAEKVFRIYKTLKETSDDYSLIGVLNWQYGRELHASLNAAENNSFLHIFELLNAVDTDIKSSGRNFPLEYLLVKLLRLRERQTAA